MTLYVSDLDGTLLDSSGRIRPRDADMLNRFIESGTLFSYCTARGISTAGEIMSSVHITAPVVLMNGVYIYDPITKERPFMNGFGDKQRELLKKAITENGETPLVFAYIDGEERVSYIEDAPNLKAFLSRRKGDKRRRPVKDMQSVFEGDIFYASFIDPSAPDALKQIFTEENGFRTACYTDTYPPYQLWLEVFSADAGKANAVRKLKELTGADEVVCFGDNSNDIPMFRAADRCYAVGNAIPEIKSIADGIIGTNECCGVPMFIESEIFPPMPYIAPEDTAPDDAKFERAVRSALERERTTIGTLNEKTIHNALKCYYCGENDREVKIGGFYADGIGESGIYEIQSANFTYLAKKLSQMLRYSHVTVVYPFERITHNYAVNEQTGEIMSVTKRTENSYSKLFLELYRLKAFLTNPNLTIRIAYLETDKKIYYKDERRQRRRGQRKEKIPLRLLGETALDSAKDYARFIPEGLDAQFTKAQLQKLCRPTDAGLMLTVLEFVGAVRRCGKAGRCILWTAIS